MKLHLTNFGCWGSSTHEFPDQGLILISGPSGKGKTTLLKAIDYALTGETKMKTVSYDKSSCKVVFEFKGMKITRINTPKTINLEYQSQKYEGAEAESMIQQIVGKHFPFAGHIRQKGESSFLGMKPSEKLSFLEDVVFADLDIQRIKNKVISIRKKHSDDIKVLQGEYNFFEKMNLPIPSKPDFTGTAKQFLQKIEETKELLSSQEVEIEKVQSLEQENLRLQFQLDSLNKQISEFKLPSPPGELMNDSELCLALKALSIDESPLEEEKKLRKIISEAEKTEILRSTLGEVHPDLPIEDIIPFQLQLSEVRKYQKYLSELTKYQEAQSRIEREFPLSELKSQIDNFEIDLFTEEDQSNLSEYLQTVESYERNLANQKKRENHPVEDIKALQTEISDKEQELSMYKLRKDVKHCPKCHTGLLFRGYQLEEFQKGVYSAEEEKKIQSDLLALKKLLSTAEYNKKIVDNLPPVEEIELESPIEEFKEAILELFQKRQTCEEQLSKRKELEKNYQLLASSKILKELSSLTSPLPVEDPGLTESEALEALVEAQKENKKALQFNQEQSSKRERLSKLPSFEPLEILRERLSILEEASREYHSQLSKRKDLERELQSIQQQNLAIEKEQKYYTERQSQLQELISQKESLPPVQSGLTEKVSELLALQKKSRTALKTYEARYLTRKQYEEEKVKYDDFQLKWKDVQTQLSEKEKKLTLVSQFEQKLKQAEHLAISGLIEEINSAVQPYLDIFFPESPLTMEIKMFKETDKGELRNTVNIEIGHRGITTKLDTLSGGEKDRINLALTLALADVFTLPLMMFDETLSSLDRDATENILEHIQNKQLAILVVAHQVTTGMFDHVIEV